MREVVDELGPDPLQTPQLRHVLHYQPDARYRGATRPNRDRGSDAGPDGQLSGSRSRFHRALGNTLDPRIDESLQGRSADHCPGSPLQHDVGRAVGKFDRQIVSQPHDSCREKLGQIAGVVGGLLGVPARIPGFLDGAAYQPLYTVGIASAGRILEPLDGPPPRYRDRERPAQQHRQADDEEDNG